MSIKDIKNNDLEKVSAGALGGPGYGKYLFWCESCGFKWFGDKNPKDVEECPKCNRWCFSKDDKDNSGKKYIRYVKLDNGWD